MDIAQKTLKISGGKIWLNSGLDQDAFGRTNLALSIEETGKIAEFDAKNVKFSDFEFAQIKSDENQKICFTANLDFETDKTENNAKTFLEILNSDDFSSNEKKSEAEKLILALSYAYENKIELKISGAEGIIFTNQKIIFLPPELFEQCASNCCDEENFKYIYKGLNPDEQILFFRSAAAYKILTGKLPFDENDLTKRQTDIADEKFIPIELYLPNLDEKLAKSIDAGLKIKPEAKKTSGRREFTNQKEEKKRKEILSLAEDFDAEKFREEVELKDFSDETENGKKGENKSDFVSSAHQEDAVKILEAKRESFLKKKTAKVAAKRFFRRNKNGLFLTLGILFFVLWMASGFVRENRLLATTKGLTSTQAAAVMYTFIHKADVPDLQEVAKGKYTKDLIFKVAGFYVTAKQREEQNAQDKSVAPGEWLFYKRNPNNWMYGITNLKIDGKSFPAESEFPQRKDKPAILSEENGKKIKRGDKTSHLAQYFLVHQDSNRIYAEKISENVSLVWNGNRWIVENIESENFEQIFVDVKNFSDEYYALLENGKSVKEAASEMREKYSWLPDENDMKRDAQSLIENYGSKEAEKFLSSAEQDSLSAD